MRTLQHRTPFHALRSSAIATVIVLLAASAHVAGGGELPTFPVLLALVAVTGLATTFASRFKLNLVAMSALLGASQFILHDAFSAFAPVGVTGPRGSHHVGTELLTPVLDPAAHLHDPGTAAGALMLVAHALATVASAVALSKGEDALWQLATWLRPLAVLPTLLFKPDAGATPLVVGAPVVFIPRPWRNLRQDSRRGPPAAVVHS
ncbi:hypothetical protein [Paenarthrobacter ureafaciens]|uniref:hypothetical protein n=1 Tax=Paenarthrobacter ureafaciens TaxID=37931 RepID=UPI002DBE67BF|nr:hypothetical protein [Paenarthrobacter ureafaciens]MEC3851281.1 hypothetical protein [Paenarthrobacter ureafaciens]